MRVFVVIVVGRAAMGRGSRFALFEQMMDAMRSGGGEK
jgi:hypothetical protein